MTNEGVPSGLIRNPDFIIKKKKEKERRLRGLI
jgi:hypothetical protein